MAGQATLATVQSLYLAYYGRPADPEGLNFWANVVEANGGDINVIINDFSTAPEYQQRFGSLDNPTLVNNLYLQMFGRNAEPDGLTFWVGQITSGSQTLGQVASTISSLASGIDLQVLNGRVALANAFTSNLATNTEALANFNTVTGLGISRDYLNQVKSTTIDNVSAYVANAAETVATLPPSTGGGSPAPTPPAITLSADSGVSLTDHITNVDVQTVSGIYTGKSGNGNQVQVKVGNGVWMTASLDEDTSTWSLSDVMLENGRGTLSVQTVDSENNYIMGTGYGYSYTLDTERPTDVAFDYELVGKVSVTSNEAGNAGLYDADSTLIAGTTTTKLIANVELTVAVSALDVLTFATVKVQDVAGNFADDNGTVAIGTNGADLFSIDQDSSMARYGFGGDDTFEFTNSTAMSEANVYGGSGIDTVTFTEAFETLSEGNFNGDVANLTGIENVKLFGASSINIGDEVHTAGINKILTGDDDTLIRYDQPSLGQITIDGSALASGKTLTLTMYGESADFVVTNLHGNLVATDLGNNDIQVTAVSDSRVTITTGSANDTVIGGADNDIINAGNGTNSITGGKGVDTLMGGEDESVDTFNFAKGDAADYTFIPSSSLDSIISDGDSFSFTSGTDVVVNFARGTDQLSIAGVTGTMADYVNGNIEAVAIVNSGSANFVRGIYDTEVHMFAVSSGGSDTLVMFNSGSSQEAIVLTGVTELSAVDIASVSQVA